MRFFLGFIFFFLMLSPLLGAYTLEDILNNKEQFDGKEVIIEGEPLGDIIKKDREVLVNIKSGGSFIGLYLPLREAEKIQFTRRYLQEPDRIRIKGIFHKECSLHGGEQDIHVKELEVLKKGRALKEVVPQFKIRAIIILSAMTLSLLFFNVLLTRREKELLKSGR